jgi:HD-like signal output (HDOD) protein
MAEPYLTELIKRVPMFARLPAWQFEAIVDATELVSFDKKQTLLQRGSDDGFTYFLAEGEIAIEAADGMRRTIVANEDSRQTPIANLRPRILNVMALGRVRVVRIPDIILSASGCNGGFHPVGDIAIETPEDAERREAEARLSFDLYRDLVSDKAILPSLPDLAMRIRQAIEDESAAAKTVARLVESDPAMAAKLLKAANSALFGGMHPVETCSAAIVRLGLQSTKQLVLSFALREVFNSRDPRIRKRMHLLWKHSSKIAAICFVLARGLKQLQAEEALLIGLLHDVGAIAILNYVERYPRLLEQEGALEQTISRMRGELGAMILRQWKFPPEIVAGARDAEDWLRTHDRAADFTDLLIVAQIHECMRKHDTEGLPPLERISAFKRVLGDDAGPEKSVQILHDAKDQLDEMRSVLRG